MPLHLYPAHDQLNTDHNALKVVHANIFLNFATTAMKVPHYFGKTDDITPQFAQMIYGESARGCVDG